MRQICEPRLCADLHAGIVDVSLSLPRGAGIYFNPVLLKPALKTNHSRFLVKKVVESYYDFGGASEAHCSALPCTA